MKKEHGFIYRIFLLIGDALAIIFSFSFAYYFRTHIDPRPYFFDSELMDFIFTNMILLPIWVIILICLGVYSKRIMNRPLTLALRLFIASIRLVVKLEQQTVRFALVRKPNPCGSTLITM